MKSRSSASQPKFKYVVVCGECGVGHATEAHAHVFTYKEDDKHFGEMDCIDAISQQVIYCPCVLPCGHTFSEHCGIKKHLRARGDCPICRAMFTEANLVPASLMVKNMMNSFQVIKIVFKSGTFLLSIKTFYWLLIYSRCPARTVVVTVSWTDQAYLIT